MSLLSPQARHIPLTAVLPCKTKQTGHKKGASESLNGGDPPSETEQRATRSAIRSRRNSAELHASGTVQERKGRDVALSSSSSSSSSVSSSSSPPLVCGGFGVLLWCVVVLVVSSGQSGPNQGNPTGAVNIPMLTSLLKAANDDRNIVVRKAAGASAPAVPEWRR